MTFSEAVRSAFSNYVTFSGRAARPEFWWWVLFVVLLMAVTSIIDGLLVAPLLGFSAFQGEAGQPLGVIVSLAIFLPGLAIAIRRLHDTGRSGWWILIGLIPIIGALILLYWYVQPSQEGSNPYG